MSFLRGVESYNNLPLTVFLRRFFEAYNEYIEFEIEKLKKDTPGNLVKIEFLKIQLEKVQFCKIDVEVMHASYVFLKCLDSEYTIIRMEVQRILHENANISEQISVFDKKRQSVENELISASKELQCWKAIFRIRNLEAAEIDEESSDLSLCIEEEYLDETPTEKTKPFLQVCKNFLQESNYDLAIKFLEENIDKMTKTSKTKVSIDSAFLHAFIAEIFYLQGDYVHAVEHLEVSLQFRKALLKPEDPVFGSLLYNYALCLIKTNRLKEGENNLKLALILKQKEFQNKHEIIAKIQATMGHICDNGKKTTEAIAYYKSALAVLESMKLSSSILFVGVSVSLCRCYINLKDQAAAETTINYVFKALHKKHKCKSNETVFEYLKKWHTNATADYLLHFFGSIEFYDICNLIKLTSDMFKSFPGILEILDSWKLLSHQKF